MDCVGRIKNQTLRQFFWALKAHPDFIGDSPFQVAPPQRFTVEG